MVRLTGLRRPRPKYGGSYSHGDSFTARARSRSSYEDYSDLVAVVNAAIAEGTVYKDKCAIGGYSACGYLSYVAVTRDSIFHFAAAVCGGGYTDGDLTIQTSDTLIYATHLSQS
jgi:dipeptidyl aminopeptidase/acylaminoacyl peptidase